MAKKPRIHVPGVVCEVIFRAKARKKFLTAEIEDPPTKETYVSQGWQVFLSGILGMAFGLAPAIFYAPPWGLLVSGKVYHFGFAPSVFQIPTVRIISLFFWSCVVGIPFTRWWWEALHDRVDRLKAVEEQTAERIAWLPAWVGIFERPFYCLLIGCNIEGGAALIGAWIALKTAGGWRTWSKGTTYGRAVFFAGLLSNAMSVLFGVVPGLLMRLLLFHY